MLARQRKRVCVGNAINSFVCMTQQTTHTCPSIIRTTHIHEYSSKHSAPSQMTLHGSNCCTHVTGSHSWFYHSLKQNAPPQMTWCVGESLCDTKRTFLDLIDQGSGNSLVVGANSLCWRQFLGCWRQQLVLAPIPWLLAPTVLAPISLLLDWSLYRWIVYVYMYTHACLKKEWIQTTTWFPLDI